MVWLKGPPLPTTPVPTRLSPWTPVPPPGPPFRPYTAALSGSSAALVPCTPCPSDDIPSTPIPYSVLAVPERSWKDAALASRMSRWVSDPATTRLAAAAAAPLSKRLLSIRASGTSVACPPVLSPVICPGSAWSSQDAPYPIAPGVRAPRSGHLVAQPGVLVFQRLQPVGKPL